MRTLVALALALAAAPVALAAPRAGAEPVRALCRGGVVDVNFVPGTVADLERIAVATPAQASIWCGTPRRAAALRLERGRLVASTVALTLVCRLPRRIAVVAGPGGTFSVALGRRVVLTALVGAATSRVAWDASRCHPTR